MTLAVFFVVVGLVDLVPWWSARRVVPVAVGALALGAVGVGMGLGRAAAWVVPAWLVGLVGWELASHRALTGPPGRVAAARTVALASLLVAVGALVLLGDGGASIERLGPQGSLLDGPRLPVTLMGLGVALVQVGTVNRVVRFVLSAVGVPAASHEHDLRGGRVLGPLERLVIVVLGLAGQLGAAAVVVAAKGLLRYPELRAAGRDHGPTDLSEYFLIGSFVSWLLALAGALLVLPH